jgi:methionyl-tRNA synthetase
MKVSRNGDAMGQRTIVMTAALPYANGDLHIGHMLEHLICDFWTRFQKMRGHDAVFICADDTHGTPIMIAARKQGISPEELIAEMWQRHVDDFRDFEIQHDHYSSTNSPTNRSFAEYCFDALQKSGVVESKPMTQLYCPKDGMFLPDRFVKGVCPKCKAADQYGDNCEVCSATYETLDLINPACSLCNTTPVPRDTEHLFVRLEDFRDFLKEWVPGHVQKEISNKLNEWLASELQPWCISRDEPYFGFEIPGYPNKYFYVWMDAPIGYVSSTKEYCDKHGKRLDHYWKNPKSEIYHCIGKDIVYFHTLFWPAILKSAGFNTPTEVMVHGFLTVDGVKMSKSRGTFIMARNYLQHLDPTFLRYYMACKINDGIDDVDLSLDDFTQRVNSDLIGKITNIASRSAQMLARLDNRIGEMGADGRELVKMAQNRSEEIASYYEAHDFARAMIVIREIADAVNKFFDDYMPWKLVKTDEPKTKEVLAASLNVFRILSVYLKPVLPSYVAKVEKLFNESPYSWEAAQKTVSNHELAHFEHLLGRVDPKKVQEMIDKQKEPGIENRKEPSGPAKGTLSEIEITDFHKVDLRVAKIINAQVVEGADKLLQLTLDLGGERRNVFSGIRLAYKPEDLVGRLTVVVANLKPRKMKFGMSEGMVLAAGPGGKEIFLLSPDAGAEPGQRIT